VLVDLAVFFRTMAEANDMFYLPVQVEQTLWLDELKLLSETPEDEPADDGMVINDYSSPLRGVAFLGGDSIEVTAPEAEGDQAHVQIKYSVPAGTLMAIIHQVPGGLPADTKALTLRARCDEDATFFINMEEQTDRGDENKAGYNASITISGGPDWQTLTVPIAEFTLGEEHEDLNGKLDLEHVQMVMLANIRSLVENVDIEGVLYLDELATTTEAD